MNPRPPQITYIETNQPHQPVSRFETLPPPPNPPPQLPQTPHQLQTQQPQNGTSPIKPNWPPHLLTHNRFDPTNTRRLSNWIPDQEAEKKITFDVDWGSTLLTFLYKINIFIAKLLM